jgi:hypothetical protein
MLKITWEKERWSSNHKKKKKTKQNKTPKLELESFAPKGQATHGIESNLAEGAMELESQKNI